MKAITGREFKDTVYSELAKIGKALSDPKRMEILDLLGQSDKNVETISDLISADKAITSHHLQVLKTAKLVSARKDGRFVIYHITQQAGQILHLFTSIGEDISSEIACAVHSFFEAQSQIRGLDYNDLAEQIAKDEVVLIDVRPRDEYDAGHFPGAVSYPLKELREKITGLPRNKKVIAYCRGPYCVLSEEAVSILKEKNYQAFRIRDGIREWTNQSIQLGMPENSKIAGSKVGSSG